jgi:hypothetical protein
VDILRDFVVPKLLYELVLGDAHHNTLKRMDIMIRTRLRAWLHFPKVAAIAYFYVPMSEGGLGIMRLGIAVPLMGKQRLQKMLSTDKNITNVLRGKGEFRMQLRHAGKTIHVENEIVTTKVEYQKAELSCLKPKLDGRDLVVPDVWIRLVTSG